MEQKDWKELLQKYKNYIIVLVILLVAIVTLARSCGQNKTENSTETTQQNQTEQTDPSVQAGQTEAEEEPNELEENTHSSVERLVSKYLDCIVNGDTDALSEIVDDLSDSDKEEVQKLSKAYEAYSNLECYTKKRTGG